MNKTIFRLFMLTMTGMFIGCSGSHLVIKEDNSRRLSQCFPLPNCVSSDSWLFYNSADPFELAVPADKAWAALKQTVTGLPRTEIVEEQPGYIHAKCRSLVFRFVDNLEFLLDTDKNIISVRSSSVLGLFDFGVNYLRVRGVRKTLAEKGIIKP